MPCAPPIHAFRVSFKFITKKSWIIYKSNRQPMRIPPSEIHTAPQDNEAEIMDRLYGHNLHIKMGNQETRERLAAAIHCRTAVGGSDGSLKDGEMVIGWALETREGEECRIEGAGMVDGNPATNDSTRAERGGRISILGAVLQIAEQYELQQGHVKILIDNITALAYGNKPREGDGPFKHLTDDYDLKCWVTRLEMRLLKKHNIVITYKHVYSHQDDPQKLIKINKDLHLAEATKRAKSPSPEALLNIACDKAAERGREILAGMPRINPITPKEAQVVLNIGGTHIYRNMKEAIE